MILLKALLEQDKLKYTLFVDMDGVLVDFEKGYEQLTGISTQQSNEQGKNKFWDLYRDSLEQKNIPEKDYWSNLSWMPDGQTLWNYVKPYNPYVLTAPSVNFDLPREQRYTREFNQSIQGKLLLLFITKQLQGGPDYVLSSQTEKLMAGTKFSDYLGLNHYKKAKKLKHFIHLRLTNRPQSFGS